MGDGLFDGKGKEACMKEYKINFRCVRCNKLLAKADGDTEIKCPRCGMINRLSVSDGEEPKKEPVYPDGEMQGGGET